jgi:hypothetical protein
MAVWRCHWHHFRYVVCSTDLFTDFEVPTFHLAPVALSLLPMPILPQCMPPLISFHFSLFRELTRRLESVLGGVLLLVGARVAGGCTSGHGISGYDPLCCCRCCCCCYYCHRRRLLLLLMLFVRLFVCLFVSLFVCYFVRWFVGGVVAAAVVCLFVCLFVSSFVCCCCCCFVF